MTGNIIEMRPGISKLDFSREPLGPETPVIPLTNEDMQISALAECREYVLDIHSRLYFHTSNGEFAKATRLAQTLATLMQAISTARIANEAIKIAREVDAACRAAMEAAERL